MAATTATKTKQVVKNSGATIAIELMAAAQALDFGAPLKPGRGTQAALDAVRRHVKHLEEDRPLHADITTLTAVVQSSEILRAVEKAVGNLM
jgi:histidine ammonia-lyase